MEHEKIHSAEHATTSGAADVNSSWARDNGAREGRGERIGFGSQKFPRQPQFTGRHHDLPAQVHDVLRSRGKPLDSKSLPYMEQYFGHNFRDVQIHDDSKAAQSARSVNASAYTVGKHLVFATGAYDPGTASGKQLLAHELTHVIQQSGTFFNLGRLKVGGPGDTLEHEAETHAANLANPAITSGGISRLPRYNLLQRQVAGTTTFLPPLAVSSDEVEIAASESISDDNPKLVQLAAAFKQKFAGDPGVVIKLSADLTEASKMSSAKQVSERTNLRSRMIAIQNVISKSGISPASIEIVPATAFSTRANGQVTCVIYKAAAPSPQLLNPVPFQGPVVPPATASTSGSLSDMLSFHFKGAPFEFSAELPKSVSARLPVALKGARTLSFELKAESSGDFSFSVALNGNRHFNVSAKAAMNVDKDKGTSGSVGLEITTTKTVCNAPSPESLKATITAAGEKLMKAGKELEVAKPDERLSKLMDMAGAIGEMYDAVDKSKNACKEVPRATLNLGLKGPLSPSDSFINDPDPAKRPATYIGGTLTFPF